MKLKLYLSFNKYIYIAQYVKCTYLIKLVDIVSTMQKLGINITWNISKHIYESYIIVIYSYIYLNQIYYTKLGLKFLMTFFIKMQIFSLSISKSGVYDDKYRNYIN